MPAFREEGITVDARKLHNAAKENNNNNNNIIRSNKNNDDDSNNGERVTLTLDDVEELNRRREQLRSDVETSLARIGEMQTWIRSANSGEEADADAAAREQHEHAQQHLTAARAALSAVP
ncbi:hypothetical protein DQ04_11751000, partial [Trypanosoma grayi]|uniref:hypothetical protein n=1 Tax=Trypanosoma grayi TaxID=71804 RepID=UPI0004F48E4B